MNTRYILIGIAVSAVVTFALRALPFVIFGGKRQMPEMLENWNTKSRWRFGDRRDIQMEAQYASEYLAGDCELYGDVASGMRKREMEKFHSSEPLFLAVISAIGLRIICTQNPTIE